MKEKHVYQVGNAEVVVYRPELTEEERAKRERQIVIALNQFGKAMVDAEKRKTAVGLTEAV